MYTSITTGMEPRGNHRAAREPTPEPGDHPSTFQKPVQRMAILAALLLPITLLPYLATRRQLSILRRQVNEFGSTVGILQHSLRDISREAAAARELKSRIHDVLDGTRRDLVELQSTTRRLENQCKVSMGICKNSRDENTELRRLLEETILGVRQLRATEERHEDALHRLQKDELSRRGRTTFQELGKSLADVAAFMQEVELEHGLSIRRPDQRGIDSLRTLALKLQQEERPTDAA